MYVIARRTFRDARTRTLAFAYLFAAIGYLQPLAYRHGYPTRASRVAFAASFSENKAVRLFYGVPRNLLTVGGYTAWRVGGTLAIVAAVWGVLAAVRAFRAEEDSGRSEIVLAAPVRRRSVYGASLLAIGAGALLLGVALFAGLALAGLPLGGSAYLSLAVVSVVPVFVGIGALASELAGSRRTALELGSTVVALMLLLRFVADTSRGLSWLSWLTPLGWAEQLRPFTDARPLVLALPLLCATALFAAAGRLATRRDVGSGVLPARDTRPPRLRLLSSPMAQALRSARPSWSVWALGLGAFALITGLILSSVSSAGISGQLSRELAKLGAGSIATPKGYLGFTFLFFVFAIALFACAQIAAARQEESEQRLETMFALPVRRDKWLSGRSVLAAAGIAALSLLSGVVVWIGASIAGVSLSLLTLLEAGANCIPVALLFLGLAALAYALLPRAAAAISYGLVTAAFLWQLVGALLGVPRWIVNATPFAHVGLVPAAPFRVGAALIMVAIGLLAAAAAVIAFRRRDLVGS